MKDSKKAKGAKVGRSLISMISLFVLFFLVAYMVNKQAQFSFQTELKSTRLIVRFIESMPQPKQLCVKQQSREEISDFSTVWVARPSQLKTLLMERRQRSAVKISDLCLTPCVTGNYHDNCYYYYPAENEGPVPSILNSDYASEILLEPNKIVFPTGMRSLPTSQFPKPWECEQYLYSTIKGGAERERIISRSESQRKQMAIELYIDYLIYKGHRAPSVGKILRLAGAKQAFNAEKRALKEEMNRINIYDTRGVGMVSSFNGELLCIEAYQRATISREEANRLLNRFTITSERANRVMEESLFFKMSQVAVSSFLLSPIPWRRGGYNQFGCLLLDLNQ